VLWTPKSISSPRSKQRRNAIPSSHKPPAEKFKPLPSSKSLRRVPPFLPSQPNIRMTAPLTSAIDDSTASHSNTKRKRACGVTVARCGHAEHGFCSIHLACTLLPYRSLVGQNLLDLALLDRGRWWSLLDAKIPVRIQVGSYFCIFPLFFFNLEICLHGGSADSVGQTWYHLGQASMMRLGIVYVSTVLFITCLQEKDSLDDVR
jgi:hypothetical protein